MTQFILHRENQAKRLKDLPKDVGVEIDIRSDGVFSCGLKVAHDPWTLGENFETWIKYFLERGFTGPILVNTKEDGLETRTILLLQRYKIKNFLFIDTSPPTVVRLAHEGQGEFLSVRCSKYETLESCLTLKGLVKNAWVDSFQGEPVDVNTVEKLSQHFKIYLASPELHTGNFENVKKFAPLAKFAAGVCTKSIEEWEKVKG